MKGDQLVDLYSSILVGSGALLIPNYVLRDISKVREGGQRTEMLRIIFQLVKSFTHLVNHRIKRCESQIRQLLFA